MSKKKYPCWHLRPCMTFLHKNKRVLRIFLFMAQLWLRKCKLRVLNWQNRRCLEISRLIFKSWKLGLKNWGWEITWRAANAVDFGISWMFKTQKIESWAPRCYNLEMKSWSPVLKSFGYEFHLFGYSNKFWFCFNFLQTLTIRMCL